MPSNELSPRDQFYQQLESFAKPGFTEGLCVNQNGELEKANVLWTAIQTIKGWFGGESQTDSRRVEGAVLLLLTKGKEYLDSEGLKKVGNAVERLAAQAGLKKAWFSDSYSKSTIRSHEQLHELITKIKEGSFSTETKETDQSRIQEFYKRNVNQKYPGDFARVTSFFQTIVPPVSIPVGKQSPPEKEKSGADLGGNSTAEQGLKEEETSKQDNEQNPIEEALPTPSEEALPTPSIDTPAIEAPATDLTKKRIAPIKNPEGTSKKTGLLVLGFLAVGSLLGGAFALWPRQPEPIGGVGGVSSLGAVSGLNRENQTIVYPWDSSSSLAENHTIAVLQQRAIPVSHLNEDSLPAFGNGVGATVDEVVTTQFNQVEQRADDTPSSLAEDHTFSVLELGQDSNPIPNDDSLPNPGGKVESTSEEAAAIRSNPQIKQPDPVISLSNPVKNTGANFDAEIPSFAERAQVVGNRVAADAKATAAVVAAVVGPIGDITIAKNQESVEDLWTAAKVGAKSASLVWKVASVIGRVPAGVFGWIVDSAPVHTLKAAGVLYLFGHMVTHQQRLKSEKAIEAAEDKEELESLIKRKNNEIAALKAASETSLLQFKEEESSEAVKEAGEKLIGFETALKTELIELDHQIRLCYFKIRNAGVDFSEMEGSLEAFDPSNIPLIRDKKGNLSTDAQSLAVNIPLVFGKVSGQLFSEFGHRAEKFKKETTEKHWRGKIEKLKKQQDALKEKLQELPRPAYSLAERAQVLSKNPKLLETLSQPLKQKKADVSEPLKKEAKQFEDGKASESAKSESFKGAKGESRLEGKEDGDDGAPVVKTISSSSISTVIVSSAGIKPEEVRVEEAVRRNDVEKAKAFIARIISEDFTTISKELISKINLKELTPSQNKIKNQLVGESIRNLLNFYKSQWEPQVGLWGSEQSDAIDSQKIDMVKEFDRELGKLIRQASLSEFREAIKSADGAKEGKQKEVLMEKARLLLKI